MTQRKNKTLKQSFEVVKDGDEWKIIKKLKTDLGNHAEFVCYEQSEQAALKKVQKLQQKLG